MKKKTTYLLPILVDICCHGDPTDVLLDLNAKLMDFFEKYKDAAMKNSNSVDATWSAFQNMELW